MSSRRKSPVNLVTTEEHNCSIDLRLKILARLPFFAGLSQQDLEAVNHRFIETGYEASQPVYHTGDSAERLFVVADGKVKLLQHTTGGRDVLLDLLTCGEFFGALTVLGAETYSDTAVAQTSTCVLSIRADAFAEILEAHPNLALKALKIMADRLGDAYQRVSQLSAFTAEKRIAVTLLKLARKFGSQQKDMLLIDVPLSRDDIAEMTGSTPETASRVISQYQSAGILTSGRLWIGVLDLAGLEKEIGQE